MPSAAAVGGDLIRTLMGHDRVVAVVGAGGKKTTMYALADAYPGRVALSSTSHMYRYDNRYVDAVVSGWPAAGTLPDASRYRVVAFSGETDTPDRVGGLTEEALGRLVHEAGFDAVVFKADGARARWIKAPASYEPVVPAFTERVIYVVSARALGATLDDRIAHRPARIAAVSGAREGQPLEPQHLGRLIASSEGGLKGVGAAHVLPLINAVDDDRSHALAREAAEIALAASTRFDRVVLARMREGRIVEVLSR